MSNIKKDIYYQKYLKYKEKYLSLKLQKGGSVIIGKINKIFYCGFSIIIDLEENKKKVLYVQKFPPASGTQIPNMSISTEQNSPSLEIDSVSKETLINFWSSDINRQIDGSWKGGPWGSNNLMTTSTDWLTNAFIGDNLSLEIISNGIIKYNGGKGFEIGSACIIGTEDKALSCNIEFNGISYGCYVTENIMPQIANDVLFIYKDVDNNKFIKLLKRGKGPNVDMPERMMPGAGEHLEPGKDIKIKEGVIRAINEEIGIPAETINECYLINLGSFKDPGRDPRYWHYSINENENLINFGIDRHSETNGYVLYFISPTKAAPIETNPLDTEEINKKWWQPFNLDLLSIPEDKWMIIDHKKLISSAINKINEFDELDQTEKEKHKMIL